MIQYSGFKDKESYDKFELQYNAFIARCQTKGAVSATATVALRSPFQLAVMISPLYLLVTRRLSTKSFHRRTVIDLAARLGPNKPPRILAVESSIWDAIFRLAEGRISVYTALRGLADSLPWFDIDMASNCEADQQWFDPQCASFFSSKLIVHIKIMLTAMYDPTITFPPAQSVVPTYIESRFVIVV